MISKELRELLRAQPFSPIRVCLSDGRTVLIRHPDQAVVSERVLLLGLVRVSRTRPLATPATSDEIAVDTMYVPLLHIAAIEPENQAARNGKARRKKK